MVWVVFSRPDLAQVNLGVHHTIEGLQCVFLSLVEYLFYYEFTLENQTLPRFYPPQCLKLYGPCTWTHALSNSFSLNFLTIRLTDH